MENSGAVLKSINNISLKITNLCDRVETINGRTPECIVVIVYFLCHILMAFVHEPWFDEALSWLIARDASFYEIVFEAPHFEGHPSLWHLVLLPFAKLGASYEVSLSLISLAFSGTAVVLFIFKAPFKRIIRLLVPFTYFLFYQYSVISRPYCMMMLAFVFMAITYKDRDNKPGRFVLSLWFLCITSAYGIVIAGGICIAWILEMFFQTHRISKVKILGLAVLLIYVLFILWRIMPADNTYAIVHGNQEAQNGFVIRLLYSFFGLLSDSFITNVYHENDIFQNVSISTYEFIGGIVIGIMLLSLLLYFSHKRKVLLDFFIPYVILSVFTLLVYIYPTHIGIMFMFVGFHLWVHWEKDNASINSGGTLIKDISVILTCLIMFFMLYWNVGSCISDIFYEYSCGKEEYRFLVDNGLDKCTIYTDSVNVEYNDKSKNKVLKSQSFYSNTGVCILPYIEASSLINGAFNLNGSYAHIHELVSENSWEEQIKTYKDFNAPDILIGLPEMNASFKTGTVSITDYTKVFENRCSTIFKGVPGAGISDIYIKNELAIEKGIMGID